MFVEELGAGCLDEAVDPAHLHHGLVEIGEEPVAEGGVVAQVPLAAGIVIAPVIALAREINPFGVAEFVAHEVEIAVPGRGQGDKPDHLVQGDPAVYEEIL